MKDSNSPQSQSSAEAPKDMGFSPWQRLKTKRISYLTLPLLAMATVTEIVILATGWKYQQIVCVPQGMGVTFLGIGPIGATILAVELLKLPLAIWTASREGWQKVFMLTVGLPLICVLTFQLVKDMAVYEMGVAMTPASQMLEKASEQEIKIAQLNGQLQAVEQKKTDKDQRLSALAAKQAKAKAQLEDSLKRNDAARQDAINLTDYQKKELSEVEARQATIIKQFDADTEAVTKAIADLRARREAELARATKWNSEEARIENAYKAKLADYTNRKNAYLKEKAEYDDANFVRRKFMTEPVDPGVAPEREVNTILKPTLITELEGQIKAKEAELININNKRRERVAQVDADARKLRAEFDQRSTTKRAESDKKREDLSTALATLANEEKAEHEKIDAEFASVQKNVDGIQAEIDACRKKAEAYYEEREASIRRTQVHRIATTVEIVRGLIMGERPMSIKATAKERGDILTDQISMVRIWVYPVLAFIVAFLPTLMVEIGFSTVFQPEQARPPHRLGLFGRHMHWLYIRAGRQKILRAERLAGKASAEIAIRDRALADARTVSEKALAEKNAELEAAHEAINSAAAKHAEQLKRTTQEHAEQLQRLQEEHVEEAKKKEAEWVAKLAGMADSLNRTVVEKDALRDLQKSEVERQVQMRQNAWSDRLTKLRQEVDDQRAASEAERTALMQEHHKKLMEMSEDCKTQIAQARRQLADVELASVEKTARLEHDLKAALHDRDEAKAQLKHESESLALKLSQSQEDGAREIEKAARQEKHRSERQQLEFDKTLRQREEEFERRQKQREQEMTVAFEACLAEERNKLEQAARIRESELERQLEARTRELQQHWNDEAQKREDTAFFRLNQREQQLQSELSRQLDAQGRDAEMRLKQELQQKELSFQAKLKQREQEMAMKAEARETELQSKWASDLRQREEEWERQAQSRIRAVETRLGLETQQREEQVASKTRQRDQQWQAKVDAARAEAQAQNEELLRRRDAESATALHDLESALRKEMQQKEEAAQARVKQREQEVAAQLNAQAETRQAAAQAKWEAESEAKVRAAIEPYKTLLARLEQERNEAEQAAAESTRQAENLEKRLTEASSFLNTWRNGKRPVGAA